MHLKKALLVLAYMHNFLYLQCLEERLPKAAMIVQFSKEIVQLSGEIAQVTQNWQQWLIAPTVGIIAYMLRRTFPTLCNQTFI